MFIVYSVIFTYIYILYINTHTLTHVYTHVYIHIYTYIYIFIYTYIYTHVGLDPIYILSTVLLVVFTKRVSCLVTGQSLNDTAEDLRINHAPQLLATN